MADCSDFKTFAEEKKRMCQSLEPQTLCPLKQGWTSWLCDECKDMCFQETDFAIKTVQKWSDEHPRKTRQSEFLKMYPNAMLCEGEYLNIAPCHLDRNIRKGCSESCINCHREYWLTEVE